jgi:PD-(D/E)XK endonuclease
MKIHHTKNKGDLGVLKSQADLCSRGYLVCLPLSEHAPFDLVVYKDNKFKRVQVKSRTIDKNGCITVRFEHSYSDSKGVHTQKVNREEIDFYCVYCLDNDTCYYFDPRTWDNDKTLSLRVKTPRNNQIVNVKFADDYREVP